MPILQRVLGPYLKGGGAQARCGPRAPFGFQGFLCISIRVPSDLVICELGAVSQGFLKSSLLEALGVWASEARRSGAQKGPQGFGDLRLCSDGLLAIKVCFNFGGAMPGL